MGDRKLAGLLAQSGLFLKICVIILSSTFQVAKGEPQLNPTSLNATVNDTVSTIATWTEGMTILSVKIETTVGPSADRYSTTCTVNPATQVCISCSQNKGSNIQGDCSNTAVRKIIFTFDSLTETNIGRHLVDFTETNGDVTKRYVGVDVVLPEGPSVNQTTTAGGTTVEQTAERRTTIEQTTAERTTPMKPTTTPEETTSLRRETRKSITTICKDALIWLKKIEKLALILNSECVKQLIATLQLNSQVFCITVLKGFPQAQLIQLQQVQNAAAKICTSSPTSLSSLNLPTVIKTQIAVICTTGFLWIRELDKLTINLPSDCVKQLMALLELNRLIFCNTIQTGFPKYLLIKLEQTQRAAAEKCTNLPDRLPTNKTLPAEKKETTTMEQTTKPAISEETTPTMKQTTTPGEEITTMKQTTQEKVTSVELTTPPPPGNITVHLERNGLLLLKIHGEYKRVCNRHFNVNEAKVVCRMLSRSTDNVQLLHGVSGGEGKRNFLYFLTCIGDENSLNECILGGWGSPTCSHTDDVGIICEEEITTMKQTTQENTTSTMKQTTPASTTAPNEEDFIRLKSNGLLLVRTNESYGTVCDNSFDVNDAKVVCRMLGRPTDDVRVLRFVGGKRKRKTFVFDINCNGDENSLNDCSYRTGENLYCDHPEDVGVKCEGSMNENIAVRLAENGLLLVKKDDGEYGTVCDNYFNINAGKVVCRMLGLPTEHVEVLIHAVGGQGRNISMNYVNCYGFEESLNECTYGGWGVHNCDHSEDVGIKCRETSNENGITAHLESNGLLLVRKDGDYGTVCDDHFDVNDAKVVCRMLGLPTDNVLVLYGVSGGEGRNIFMDDVQCGGYEDSLDDCGYKGWGRHNCDHSENIGVKCGAEVKIKHPCRRKSMKG